VYHPFPIGLRNIPFIPSWAFKKKFRDEFTFNVSAILDAPISATLLSESLSEVYDELSFNASETNHSPKFSTSLSESSRERYLMLLPLSLDFHGKLI
jgi:hypothetical protein